MKDTSGYNMKVFCVCVSLLLTFALYGQKNYVLIDSTIYQFKLKSGVLFEGKLVKQNQMYYEVSDQNKTYKISKRNIDSIFIDGSLIHELVVVDTMMNKMYLGLSGGVLLDLFRIGPIPSIGYRFDKVNTVEAKIFGFPSFHQTNFGLGAQYLMETKIIDLTLGYGLMRYTKTSWDYFLIFPLPLLEKKMLSNYVNFGLFFISTDKKRVTSFEVYNFKDTPSSRVFMVSVSFAYRLY